MVTKDAEIERVDVEIDEMARAPDSVFKQKPVCSVYIQ
jgi:hypothetical protein